MSTLIIIKPEAIKDGRIGDIITRFERKGYVLSRIQTKLSTQDLVERHYEEHKGKSFYERLCAQFSGKTVVTAVVTHPDLPSNELVESVRTLIGTTKTPGSIRGDFARSFQFNVIHASDSDAAAAREIALWYQ